MRPNFALNILADGVELLHRATPGWERVGQVFFDTPDLGPALIELRQLGEAIDPAPMRCKVVIPEDQIRYLTLATGTATGEERRAMIAAHLAEATPYPLEELEFCWSTSGSTAHVAAVARETLDQAEAFLVPHGFNPVSFVAIPGNNGYLGEPYFGPTDFSHDLLDGQLAQRDAVQIHIIGNAVLPTPDLLEEPEELPEDLPEDLPQDLPGDLPGELPEDLPGDQPEEVPTPDETPDEAPDRLPNPTPEAPSDDEPAEAAPSGTPAAPLQPEAEAASAAPRPGTPGTPQGDLFDLTPDAAATPAGDTTHEAAPEAMAPAEPPHAAPVEGDTELSAPPVEASDATDTAPTEAADPTPETLPGASAETTPDGDLPGATPPVLRPDADVPPMPSFASVRAAPSVTGAPTTGTPGLPEAPRASRTPTAGPARPLGAATEPSEAAAVLQSSLDSLKPLGGAATDGTRFGALLRQRAQDARSHPPAPAPAEPHASPLFTRTAPGAQPDLYPGLHSGPETDTPSTPAPAPALPVAPVAKVPVAEVPVAPATPVAPDTGADTGTGTATPVATEPAPAAPAKSATAEAQAPMLPARTSGAEDQDARFAAFGARMARDDAPKTRRTRLLLAAALLLCLGVAGWAAVSGPLQGLFSAPEPQADPAPESALAAPDSTAAAPATSDAPEEPDTSDTLPDAAPQLGTGNDTGTDTGNDTGTGTGNTDDSAPQPPLTQPDAPGPADRVQMDGRATPATPAEAAARYAATGIWQRAPGAPVAPTTTPLGDIEVASISTVDRAQPVTGLPETDQQPPASAFQSPPVPPTADQDFVLDERGLVAATPEGALTPEGHMVYLGQPEVTPPSRPTTLTPAPDATAPETPAPETPAPETPAPEAAAAETPAPEATEEADAVRGPTGNELAAIYGNLRPRLRPADLTPEELAEEPEAEPEAEPVETGSELATAEAVRPKLRPQDFAAQIAAAQAARAPAPQLPAPEAAAPTAPAATVSPAGPTQASVARQATVENAIKLNQLNLIGVMGDPSDRSALVRLSNGSIQKVKVGDKLDGGRVAAIGESELRYIKGNRSLVLAMPD